MNQTNQIPVSQLRPDEQVNSETTSPHLEVGVTTSTVNRIAGRDEIADLERYVR